jgi:hypothetical protein
MRGRLALWVAAALVAVAAAQAPLDPVSPVGGGAAGGPVAGPLETDGPGVRPGPIDPGLPEGLRAPTSPLFADAAWYDLLAVRWVDGPTATLEVELAAVDLAGPGPLGLRQPIVEVYVDDGVGGATDLLPGSGLTMPAGTAWRDAVRITGDGVWWWRADEVDGRVTRPVPLPAEVVGRVVRVAWPLPLPEASRLYAISGVHDPFAPDGWRPFGAAPSPWAFASERPGPPVVDVLPGGAAAWADVQATGTLPRVGGRTGAAGPRSGAAWLWWTLMGVGMALAVVGVVWRAWRPAPPEPTASEPIVPEPIVPEPAASEPALPERAASEPIVPEPTASEPIVPESIVPEPAASEAAHLDPAPSAPVAVHGVPPLAALVGPLPRTAPAPLIGDDEIEANGATEAPGRGGPTEVS